MLLNCHRNDLPTVNPGCSKFCQCTGHQWRRFPDKAKTQTMKSNSVMFGLNLQRAPRKSGIFHCRGLSRRWLQRDCHHYWGIRRVKVNWLNAQYIQPSQRGTLPVAVFFQAFWSRTYTTCHRYQDAPKLPLAQTNRGRHEDDRNTTSECGNECFRRSSGDQGVNQFIENLPGFPALERRCCPNRESP